MDKFLKILKNGKKVFDFHKIKAEGYPINVIISQRGYVGKTVNAKLFIKDEYKNKGHKALWLRNLVKDLENEKQKFLLDVRRPWVDGNEFFKECEIRGDTKKNNLWCYHGKDELIKFQAINSAEDEKGSRVIYNNIFWDEFNVNNGHVPDMINKFDSLLHSTEDLVNNGGKDDTSFFIFGNNKTLNHPLLIKIGVSAIKDEITTFKDSQGNKLLLVICVMPTEADKLIIDDELKNNWRYSLSKLIGTAGHSYFNDNLYDDINGVVEKLNNNYTLRRGTTVHHAGEYYHIYFDELNILYHVCICDKPKGERIAIFSKRNAIENAALSTALRDRLFEYLIKNKLTFENYYSRVLFVESLIK